VAGIRIGERVTRVDGREVNGKQELIAALLRQNDQASVEFTLVDDTRRSFKI
jgi:S1-C subfamily serine protease